MRELSQDEQGWIILYECQLTTGMLYKVFDNISRGSDIVNYESNMTFWQKILGDKFEYFKLKCAEETIDSFLQNNLKDGVNFITYSSEKYPNKLKEIKNPPIILFYKGDIDLLNTKSIAIVGTRLLSSYGANITSKFTRTLASSGLTIVSGLAEGVDSVAHKETLGVQGKTIAVLGGGLASIYPGINTDLARDIAKNGLLITEYAFNESHKKYHFPFRNRIVAGLCDGVLVTEASNKSGTRYTVEYAMEMNRNVYAIPGNLTSYKSEYPNRLIKSCNACMVMSAEDILNDLNCDFIPKQNKEVQQIDLTQTNILAILREESKVHFDEIMLKTGLETRKLNSTLISMELMGLIVKLPSNYYSAK